MLGRDDGPAMYNPMRQYINARYRNINLFPFCYTQVMVQLRTD